MVFSRRPVLHHRRGTLSNSRRNKALLGRNVLVSILLLTISGGYIILIAGSWLVPPDELEHQTALDILRKEQAVRRQRLARLRAEAAEQNDEAPVVMPLQGAASNNAVPRKDELKGNNKRKIVGKVDDALGADIFDDKKSDNKELADDDEITDDNADEIGEQQALTVKNEQNQNEQNQPPRVDDDIAVQQRLADEASKALPARARLKIEEIRRRMDAEMQRAHQEIQRPRQIVVRHRKHDPAAKNDGKKRIINGVTSHLDRLNMKQLRNQQNAMIGLIEDETVAGEKDNHDKDNSKFEKDKDGNLNNNGSKEKRKTKPPRKLPKLDRLANIHEAPIAGDPLRAQVWEFKSKGKIPIKPAVPYLGTLVDAGRHYFPVEWLKRLVDRLSDMNYNLIHLRLTDDQTFNVLLKSRPELAYPTALANAGRKVYSTEELRDLTAYAKARNVSIMPEVNVPGHAGSWAGIPDMIVHCPEFICEKGYGLPLNVTHHDIKPILTDVIKEIVDIFDNPPFLHLGGDEVNMADPCFHEVGHEVFDYPAFELILKDIIKDSGYPEDRVVRWEMTGQANLNRAGGIEHFWESHPGVRHNAQGKFFVSTWLYCDTNNDADAFELYTKTIENFRLRDGVTPTAIILGTFELHPEFWYDRNILGRLLAVAIGAANSKMVASSKLTQRSILDEWNTLCEHLGFGEIICDTEGQPVIATRIYQNKWRQGWEVWKGDICQRLTDSVPYRTFMGVGDRMLRQSIGNGNQFFWQNFPLEVEIRQLEKRPLSVLPPSLLSLEKHPVEHVGVILDAVSAMPTIHRLHAIIQNYIVKFGLNTVQLRLIGDNGWVYESDTHPQIAHSLISGPENPLLTLRDLEKLVVDASNSGVQMIPEISSTTDAGGWINSQFLVNCPDHFCSGQGTPVDINDEKYLPVLFSVVGELRKVFNSKYVHLGSDERDTSAPCFKAANKEPQFSSFERKLETLMALADLAPGDIIRSENVEGIRYSDRTGDVTQYPAGVTDIRPDEPSFLTVDIFDGDAYKIFQNTQKAVNLKPLGVLAELKKLNDSKWQTWHIPKRLLAFAMGVSELGSSWSIYDVETFNATFTKLCLELELEEDCSPPEELASSIRIITDSEAFIKKKCEVRTYLATKRVAVPVKPFYEVTVQGDVAVIE